MATITMQTAAMIAHAHREIEVARELLKKIEQGKKWNQEIDIRDAFGRRQYVLQLGVPSGNGGHKLLDVSYELGGYIIEAHIEKMQMRIAELSEIARMELDGVKTTAKADGLP